MTANTAHQDYPIELFASTGPTTAERLVLILTSLGLTAALVKLVSVQMTRSQFTDQVTISGIVQSPIYYAAHATEILLLVSAGLVALFSLDPGTIKRGYLQVFALFLGAAVLMAARGYTLSQLFSTRLVDATGPFPCFMSVLAFVGVRRRNWVVLSKVMVIVAVLLCALVLWQMTGLRIFTRAEGVARLASSINALFWPASWIALRDYPRDSFARRLRFAPLLIYGFGSFFTQTRLNFVLLFILLAINAYLQYKRGVPQATSWIWGLMLAVWVILFSAVFLKDTRPFEHTEGVADAFYSRIDDDSRTGQLVYFASQVKPQELLLGRGSFATWYWGSFGEYTGGTDVGYLTLLFYGGVPLLLTYIAANVKPCFAVLRMKRTDWRSPAAGVVFLWGIVMLSSAYPGMSLDYCLVLLCVGACISTECS